MSFYIVKIIVRLKFTRKHKMKMYLDDIREPKDSYDVIVRSYEEAVMFVQKMVFHLISLLIMI